MKTSSSLFPGLCRSLALALCVGAALAVLTVLPSGVRAKAMSDADFIELCGTGTAEQVKRALAGGANPNARLNGPDDDGTTALIAAAHTGSSGTVAALLAAGADKSVKDRRGYDALWYAKNSAQYGVEYGGPRAERLPDPAALAAEHRKVIRLLESGGGKTSAPARAAHTETSRVRAAAERLRTGEDVSPEAAAAANSLGVWHEKGTHGLRRDTREAARWYALAAEHGNALAMHNLGDLYRQGKGVRQDSREAFRWYEKAADAGHALGLEDMADCYLKGVGVAPNRGEAVRLYREAARQGRKSAAQKLREMGE